VGDFVKPAPNAHVLLLTKPTGTVRLAFRLPAYHYGYGANLGWMLGHRFFLLTHRGRRIGRALHRVLEVLCYDLATQGSLVLSAWKDELYAPVQRFLGPEETRAALADFERRYPFFSWLASRMLASPLDGTQTARTNLASRVRMVAFSPTRPSRGRG
jgi:hypothetical protein